MSKSHDGGAQQSTSGQDAAAIESRLRDILSNCFDLDDVSELELTEPISDAGNTLDSFATLRLVAAVEEEFGVYIDDQSFHVLETLGSLLQYVSSRST